MPVEYSPYLFIFVLVLAAIAFALAPLGLAWLWARKFSLPKPGPGKNAIYECGLESKGDAWVQFKAEYYLYAIIFLIFDVEIAFTYPVATVFRRWVSTGAGLFAFLELLLFLVIVALGLAYVWAKGDLEWLKQLKSTEVRGVTPLRRATTVAPGPAAAGAAAPDALEPDAPSPAAPGTA